MSTLLIKFKLVYGPFGQSNMDSTLDFFPRPARKEMNVPLLKRSLEITVLIYIVVDATTDMTQVRGKFHKKIDSDSDDKTLQRLFTHIIE